LKAVSASTQNEYRERPSGKMLLKINVAVHSNKYFETRFLCLFLAKARFGSCPTYPGNRFNRMPRQSPLSNRQSGFSSSRMRIQ
jgi:hypothetical protein